MLLIVDINKIKDYIEGVSYSLHDANNSIEYEFKNFYPESEITVTGSLNNENIVYVEVDGSLKYKVDIIRNLRAKEFTIENINLV